MYVNSCIITDKIKDKNRKSELKMQHGNKNKTFFPKTNRYSWNFHRSGVLQWYRHFLENDGRYRFHSTWKSEDPEKGLKCEIKLSVVHPANICLWWLRRVISIATNSKCASYKISEIYFCKTKVFFSSSNSFKILLFFVKKFIILKFLPFLWFLSKISE